MPKLFTELKVDKQIKHWNELKSTKEIKDILAIAVGIAVEDLSIVYNSGSNAEKYLQVRGTYIHEKLIVNIISWASIKHSLIISDMMINIFNIELHNKANKMLSEKEKEYQELIGIIKDISSQGNFSTIFHKSLVKNNGKIVHELIGTRKSVFSDSYAIINNVFDININNKIIMRDYI